MRKRRKPELKVKNQLGTVENSLQAADLFATMLRSVEMEEQSAEAKTNDGTSHDEKTPRR